MQMQSIVETTFPMSQGAVFPLNVWLRPKLNSDSSNPRSVVFLNEKIILPAVTDGLIFGLSGLSRKTANWDWANRICYLRRS